eukprot:CAMPEP_0202948914 /NCGR_PEP_ID=MMETSP1395-20130829/14768_1 /ASSEMBLY_ACC=CAM_ASM_000871 /TAXON_ID=5961 /ORGANISM="Blepharisma japonicum, Strain Stock R1072" /LENGTH=70 /DNA_ID=CAMNT_0049651465 /DNA_START=488 /DNA_END=700 /DNA_ORIENTATION=+
MGHNIKENGVMVTHLEKEFFIIKEKRLMKENGGVSIRLAWRKNILQKTDMHDFIKNAKKLKRGQDTQRNI